MFAGHRASEATASSSLGTGESSVTTFDRYRVDWKVWLVWLAVFFLITAISPRDAHFDTAHYHLHNGWSFWHGRLGQDLAPAELHSFLNPFHSAIVWLLVSHLPGPVAIGLLGLVQALILPALYALLARLAFRMKADVSHLLLMALALTCFMSQPMMLMMSSVLNDHWGALAFIFALVLLLPHDRPHPGLVSLALASAAVGFAFGMKLTNAIYIPGLAAAVLVLVPDIRERVRGAALCATAGLGSALLSGGWWAWMMYSRFGNPVFPNLNSLFNGPLGPDSAFRDEKFLPSSVIDGVIRPFYFSGDAGAISEQSTSDYRLLIGYLASLAILGIVSWARMRGGADGRHRILLALAASFLATFVAWTWMFSIQRYVMALYLIGPVLAMGAFWLISPRGLTHQWIRLGIFLVMAAVVMTTSFERLRRVSWRGPLELYSWVSLPAGSDVENAIIIMSANYPTAFTAPAFEEAALITHGDARPWSRPALENYRPLIQSAINNSDQAIFAVMFLGQESGEDDLDRLAADYGLTASFEACQPMQTGFDTAGTHWILCPLRRRHSEEGR